MPDFEFFGTVTKENYFYGEVENILRTKNVIIHFRIFVSHTLKRKDISLALTAVFFLFPGTFNFF